MKSYTKSELAYALGVSSNTFARWIRPHYPQLEQMGVSPTAKLLPPVAVRYLCDHFCIDLDELNR